MSHVNSNLSSSNSKDYLKYIIYHDPDLNSSNLESHYSDNHDPDLNSSNPGSLHSNDDKIVKLIQATWEIKEKKKLDIDEKRRTLSGRCQFNDFDSDLWLVGGDFFSSIYLTCETVKSFVPSLAKMSAIQSVSMVFGVIAGIINIAVGISCISQAIKELKKGNKINGLRLLYDGILMILVGSIMITGTILIKLAIGGAITAIITNPILLAALFASMSIFITYEVLKKVIPIWIEQDLGSKIIKVLNESDIKDNKDNLDKILNDIFSKIKIHDEKNKEVNFSNLLILLGSNNEEKVKEVLCETMNRVEEEIGVAATLEFFKLIHELAESRIKKESEIEEEVDPGITIRIQIDKLQDQLKKWKYAQYTRLAQQILYIGASLASFGAFMPHAPRHVIQGGVNLGMSLANFIPLYMDIQWPYKRNVWISVPGVQPEEITNFLKT